MGAECLLPVAAATTAPGTKRTTATTPERTLTQPPPGDDTTDSGNTGTKDAGDGEATQPHRPRARQAHSRARLGGAPPLRFCFGFVNGDAGAITIPNIAAAPNTDQGLPPGLGGAAAKAASDLQSRTITIFGINAAKLAGQNADAGTSEPTCEQAH